MQLLCNVSERNAASTARVLEIVTMAEGFFRVLGWTGVVTKWFVSITAAAAGVYFAWRAR